LAVDFNHGQQDKDLVEYVFSKNILGDTEACIGVFDNQRDHNGEN
jgi:hypothetical protein